MKTRSQTGPKPLNTVALAPRPSSPKRKARAKPSGKDELRAPKKPPTAFLYFISSLYEHGGRLLCDPTTHLPSSELRFAIENGGFVHSMEDFRKTYKKENPSVKTMQEVGKACGEKWNTMAFEEKVKYYDIATEKRTEFEKAMAGYNKRKDKGELSGIK